MRQGNRESHGSHCARLPTLRTPYRAISSATSRLGPGRQDRTPALLLRRHKKLRCRPRAHSRCSQLARAAPRRPPGRHSCAAGFLIPAAAKRRVARGVSAGAQQPGSLAGGTRCSYLPPRLALVACPPAWARAMRFSRGILRRRRRDACCRCGGLCAWRCGRASWCGRVASCAGLGGVGVVWA
jgi:hypothetical protein